MPIPINLASSPFRRDRAMFLASAAVGLMLVATLGWLIAIILVDRAQMADVRLDVARIEKRIRAASTELGGYDALARQPGNAEVLERSVFLNSLLLRKGLSWSRIFADLEKTIPANVKVLEIAPAVDGQERVRLDMTLAADSPTPIIAMLKSFRESPLFGAVEPTSTLKPTQAEPLYRFRVSVTYAQKL